VPHPLALAGAGGCGTVFRHWRGREDEPGVRAIAARILKLGGFRIETWDLIQHWRSPPEGSHVAVGAFRARRQRPGVRAPGCGADASGEVRGGGSAVVVKAPAVGIRCHTLASALRLIEVPRSYPVEPGPSKSARLGPERIRTRVRFLRSRRTRPVSQPASRSCSSSSSSCHAVAIAARPR